MTWNHRVMRVHEPGGDVLLIREVHYGTDGNPNGYTDDAVGVVGDDIDELRRVLKQMDAALGKPILVDEDCKIHQKSVDPPTLPRQVILESPYSAPDPAGVARNVAYARRCLCDSLRRGEAPLVSHLLYTQVLDDRVPEERERGIFAGHVWTPLADAVVMYMDLGMSAGMGRGVLRAMTGNVPVEYRWLDGEPK